MTTIRPVARRKFEQAAPEFEQLAKGSRYLIHYTRACPGPWPGQKIMDYCRSLVRGDKDSMHTAFDTLMRIIRERRIRGGARLTRGNCPVVSFTECAPMRRVTSLNGGPLWFGGLLNRTASLSRCKPCLTWALGRDLCRGSSVSGLVGRAQAPVPASIAGGPNLGSRERMEKKGDLEISDSLVVRW